MGFGSGLHEVAILRACQRPGNFAVVAKAGIDDIFENTPSRVVAVYAHPDDAEVSCGGTLAISIIAAYTTSLAVLANSGVALLLISILTRGMVDLSIDGLG